MNTRLTSLSVLAAFLMQASALPVYASSHEVTAGTPAPSAPTTESAAPTAVETPAPEVASAQRPERNAVCMQKAVEQRDNALISAVDVYHTSVRGVLTARRDALKAAWGITDKQERKKELRTVWKRYKEARGKATTAFRTAKRSAWNQYAKDRKLCGSPGVSEDHGDLRVDTQL